MPISSGAEGHVGVGVDRAIKWVPEGGEDYQAVRINNSYLQRYLNHYGGEEKIKKEEMMKKTVGFQRIYNTQNKVSTKEGSDMYLTEKRRNNPNTIQESPIKETNFTMYTQENSTKILKGDSHTDANNTDMTSTSQPGKKAIASTTAPAKKSRVCVIL